MNLKALSGRPAALIAAGGVLTIAIGGFAVASIPTSNGTFHGCYQKTGLDKGDLRIIDPSNTTCRANETAISRNQQGQPGVPGATGPSGPAGPAGSQAPPGLPVLLARPVLVGSRDLPAPAAQSDSPDLRDRLDLRGPRDLQDRVDLRGHRAPPAPPAPPVRPGQLGLKDLKARMRLSCSRSWTRTVP